VTEISLPSFNYPNLMGAAKGHDAAQTDRQTAVVTDRREVPASMSVAEHSPTMLLAHFVSDAGARQPYELRERRIRSARAAGQRRNETLLTAASEWRSSLRRSMLLVERHAGQRTHRNQ
jgi:hypothetical protein